MMALAPMRRLCVAATVAMFAFVCVRMSHAAVVEEIVSLPVSVKTIHEQVVSQEIQLTIWRDESRRAAPFLILNHGRPPSREQAVEMGRARYPANARYFVSKGFAVFVPTRVGYGVSGGPDVEYSGTCQKRNFPPVYQAAADQTLAVIEYAKALPYVDRSRGLIVGQSFGGATAVALAAANIDGVRGAVNFAGGGGGDPVKSPENPCRPDLLERMFGEYGKTAKVPTLWLYSENDRYFGSTHPKQWFAAFVASGGTGQFIQLPPYKQDGHGSFSTNPNSWRPAFEEFLARVGF